MNWIFRCDLVILVEMQEISTKITVNYSKLNGIVLKSFPINIRALRLYMYEFPHFSQHKVS